MYDGAKVQDIKTRETPKQFYDGILIVQVILDAYNRLIKKSPDIFRNNFRRGEVYNNGTKGIDCRKVPVVGFEHGEKIAAYMKKVFLNDIDHQQKFYLL